MNNNITKAYINLIKKIELIEKYNLEYYNNQPIISDAEYDILKFQIQRQYIKIPILSDSQLYQKLKNKYNTIINAVGILSHKNNMQIKHKVKMYSINNAFTKDELSNWIKSINKIFHNINYICEPKIDGLSLNIIYKQGHMIYCVTRGNGIQGDDITQNIKLLVSNIPQYINNSPELIEIHGEIFITNDNFRYIRSKRISPNITIGCLCKIYAPNNKEYEEQKHIGICSECNNEYIEIGEKRNTVSGLINNQANNIYHIYTLLDTNNKLNQNIKNTEFNIINKILSFYIKIQSALLKTNTNSITKINKLLIEYVKITEYINKKLLNKNIYSNIQKNIYSINKLILLKNKLNFKVHGFGAISNDINFDNQQQFYNKCTKWGFNTSDTSISSNIDNILEFIKQFYNKKDKFNYPVDGIVIKINDIKSQQSIGYTSNAPKWAIAYKYQDAPKYTKIYNITYNIGRTGQITPCAKIQTIIINNTRINNVTLHNMNYIIKNNIHINSTIGIIKSGGIIPKIIDVKKDNLSHHEILNKCIYCSTNIIHTNNYQYSYCPNNTCYEQNYKKIIYLCSIAILDLPFGEERIKQLTYLHNTKTRKPILTLYNIFNPSDWFYNNMQDIQNLTNNFTNYDKKNNTYHINKNTINFLNLLEYKKQNTPLYKLIAGLSINQIGIETAKILVNHFNDINNIMNSTIEELKNINSISDTIANNIYNWFNTKDNIEIINNWINNNVNFNYKTEGSRISNTSLSNKTITITGKLSITRKQFIDILNKYNCKYVKNISKNVDIIVIGDAYTKHKYIFAQEHAIRILTEKEFNELIK